MTEQPPLSFQLTQRLPHRSTNQASPVSLDQPADGGNTGGENMDLKERSLGGLFFTSLRYKAEQGRVGQDTTGLDTTGHDEPRSHEPSPAFP